MQLMCKDGDLAIVVQDEDVAIANLGKVVRVSGPTNVNRRLKRVCWLIEPVNAKKWCWVSLSGKMQNSIVTFASDVEHPDAWLLPLRLCAKGDEFPETQPEEVQVAVESAT